MAYVLLMLLLHLFLFLNDGRWHSTTDGRIAAWMRALTPSVTKLV